MKDKKINPIFIAVIAVLLVFLGVVIGIGMSENNEGIKEPTESELVAPESSQVEGATEETEGIEISSEVENTGDTEQQVTDPTKNMNVEMFVILGVDSRTNQLGAGTHSDSIMVVLVNHDEKTIKVASILRDCMTKIDGYDYEKIKYANYYGGPSLALDTINTNFDLNVEEYVLVNFNSLIEVVDQVGGIELELTDAECGQMGNSRFEKAGTYVLDGKEALTYSRIRKLTGGDRKRSERQRTVLFEIFEKTKTLPVEERVELVDEMIDKINTSYRNDEIVEILYYMSQYKITDMEAFPLVYYDGLVGDLWYAVPVTLEDMNAELHKFLFGINHYTPSKTVKEYSLIMKNKVSGPNTDFRN